MIYAINSTSRMTRTLLPFPTLTARWRFRLLLFIVQLLNTYLRPQYHWNSQFFFELHDGSVNPRPYHHHLTDLNRLKEPASSTNKFGTISKKFESVKNVWLNIRNVAQKTRWVLCEWETQRVKKKQQTVSEHLQYDQSLRSSSPNVRTRHLMTCANGWGW